MPPEFISFIHVWKVKPGLNLLAKPIQLLFEIHIVVLILLNYDCSPWINGIDRYRRLHLGPRPTCSRWFIWFVLNSNRGVRSVGKWVWILKVYPCLELLLAYPHSFLQGVYTFGGSFFLDCVLFITKLSSSLEARFNGQGRVYQLVLVVFFVKDDAIR